MHRTLGTRPQAKPVRFNPQTAIRQISSCKETDIEKPDPALITEVPQVTAVTTEGDQAFMERLQALQKDADFRGTLITDPKLPNHARRFLRNFFHMVTGNSSVLRA